MTASIGQSLVLVINTLGGLLVFLVLLRFLLQAAGADFYNPVSQAIARYTAPALKPIRRFIPAYRNFDFASLVLALLLNTIATALMILAAGFALPAISSIIAWSFIGLLSFILDIYFFGLLISIIASWIAPYSGNPILLLVHQLLEPIQSRVQRFIPSLGGLDFSPIFVFLGIQVVDTMFVQSFARSLRLPSQFVIGI